MTNPIETKKFEEAIEKGIMYFIKFRGFSESRKMVQAKMLAEFPTLNSIVIEEESYKRFKLR